MRTDQELKQDGYTASGIVRYQDTVKGYSDALHSKAITFGDADKDPDLPREVTHDHVRAAAHFVNLP